MSRWFAPLVALLLAATQARAAGRAGLSVSVKVVHSVSVATSGGTPAEAAVSVRAPNGAKWSARLAEVGASRDLSLTSRARAAGDPDYVVLTVLADGSLSN